MAAAGQLARTRPTRQMNVPLRIGCLTPSPSSFQLDIVQALAYPVNVHEHVKNNVVREIEIAAGMRAVIAVHALTLPAKNVQQTSMSSITVIGYPPGACRLPGGAALDH